MRDKKILRWINEDVDGTIDTGDRRRLDHVLAKDEAAKNLREDLKHMSVLLGKVPSVEPDKEIKKRVMNVVRLHPVFVPSTARVPKTASHPFLRTGLKLTYGALIGAAATVLIMSLIDNKSAPFSMPSGDHVGAIGLNRYQQFPIVEKIEVGNENLSGTVFVRRLDRIGGLEMYLHSGEMFDVLLTYDDADLAFDMYKPFDSAAVTLKAGRGFVQILEASRDDYLLIFECRKAGPVRMHMILQKNGETLYTRDILFSPSGKKENG